MRAVYASGWGALALQDRIEFQTPQQGLKALGIIEVNDEPTASPRRGCNFDASRQGVRKLLRKSLKILISGRDSAPDWVLGGVLIALPMRHKFFGLPHRQAVRNDPIGQDDLHPRSYREERPRMAHIEIPGQ